VTAHGDAARNVLFTLVMTAEERKDLTIRADANGISSAEYVRRALAAVAAVGGSEEFLLRKTKGKKK
jgi:hypothetical protein